MSRAGIGPSKSTRLLEVRSVTSRIRIHNDHEWVVALVARDRNFTSASWPPALNFEYKRKRYIRIIHVLCMYVVQCFIFFSFYFHCARATVASYFIKNLTASFFVRFTFPFCNDNILTLSFFFLYLFLYEKCELK